MVKVKILEKYGCDLDCKDDDSNTLTSNGRMYIRLTTSFVFIFLLI